MTQQERIDYIRLRLGNISTTILPDATILAFLVVREAQFTEEPTILYYTIIDAVNFLIASYTSQGNSSRTYAQEGGVTVDIQGVNYVNAWTRWLQDFRKNPEIDGFTNVAGAGSVIVGGVRKAEVDRVKADGQSYNPGSPGINTFFDKSFR